MIEASTSELDRRQRILASALAVFARHGYRKTSMEDVARAAEVSRQGLYLLFDDKETLFREAIEQMINSGLAAVRRELAAAGPIEARVFAAMKGWYGRSVGASPDHGDELLTRSVQLARDAMERSGQEVVRLLTETIAASPLAAALAARGLSPSAAALTLDAVGQGLKHAGVTREVFKERLAAAVALITGAPRGVAHDANNEG